MLCEFWLGLKARWLLNRSLLVPKRISACEINLSQVKERGTSRAVNQLDKVKGKSLELEVTRRKCSKGTWRQFFEATGDIFTTGDLSKCLMLSSLTEKVIIAETFQKPGPCLLLSWLLSWPTQSSPPSSTTWTNNSCFVSPYATKSKHIE